MRFNILPFEPAADLERSSPPVLAKHVPTVQLRTLSPQADPDCPFLQGMLGFEEVGSAYANPLKSVSSAPGRLAQWLQSASAEVWVKFLLALVGLGTGFRQRAFLHRVARCRQPLGHRDSGLDFAGARHLGRTGYRALSGASRGGRAPARVLRLRRNARRHRLCAGDAGDRHCRAQHRQQSSLHRGRGHAGGDPGFRSRLRLGAALAGTRRSPARARFRRPARGRTHRAAQPAPVPAVVFHPRGFHAQEEKEAEQAMAMGSNHLRVSV